MSTPVKIFLLRVAGIEIAVIAPEIGNDGIIPNGLKEQDWLNINRNQARPRW